MVAYHERIYNLWKKQASKARKRKFSKNINADKVEKVEKDSLKVEEETNSHSKKKSMHRKSVSVESN